VDIRVIQVLLGHKKCRAAIKVEERGNQDERESGGGSLCAEYRIGG
jgi:hypothetical protein